MKQTPWLFSTDNITFLPSGDAGIVFHGIKNDASLTGFHVTLRPTRETKIDPVKALSDYIARTSHQRSEDKCVFLSPNPSFRPVTAKTVANILNEAINIVGLSGRGFSAKSFRPTGATLAVESGCDSEIATQIGRWKKRSVFYEHYVHAKSPETFSKFCYMIDF
ncbi:hypothetical protein HOLleu_01606 [Holothuria leucospilota]|uniref:Tyr recombinase domain-containing protein n=1 Tax=Holothuria leucospilota TaxID=206669 RepID=A0A9Q1HJB9_HOLLE|nr:hypothetical protein HOLleu_01606 [Holothuria leucospilota]